MSSSKGNKNLKEKNANTEETDGEVLVLPLDIIDEDPNQPRKHEWTADDDPTLGEMATSIMSHGVMQPILVVKNGPRYRILAGHRRYRASKIAKKDTIPVIVKTVTDSGDVLASQIVENIQRMRLAPMDLIESVLRLKNEYHMTVTEIGQKLGRHKSWISRIISVGEAEGVIKDALKEGVLSDIESAVRFRNLSSESQNHLLEEAKERKTPLTRGEIVSKKQQEFIPVEEPLKTKTRAGYEEPRGTFVSLEEGVKSGGTPEGEGDSSAPFFTETEGVRIKPDADVFGKLETPIVYRDFGTTWVIRMDESLLKKILEKVGHTSESEESIISGMVDFLTKS